MSDVQAPTPATDWAPWEVGMLFAIPACIFLLIGFGLPVELALIGTGGGLLLYALAWLVATAPVADDE